jgi:class 3 adenylate cyclase
VYQMRQNSLTPQLTWQNEPAQVELTYRPNPIFWLNLPAAQLSQPVTLESSAIVTPLIQELTYRCQALNAICERQQRLQAIVRPFLPTATWDEAAKAARQGQRVLPTETRQASLLRLDIAGFTELMSQYPLEQILADLNAYFALLTPLIEAHHGEVSKYLGDGLLAVFASADDAVQAGSAMQQAIAEFNQHQVEYEGPIFYTRIGIDSGQFAVVSLGSVERQDRTIIGMPVNLAERLQAQAKPSRVLFSEATFARLHDQAGCRCLGSINVKGQAEPVVVYEK